MSQSGGAVIFAILCGQRQYVRILMRYVRRLLDDGVVDRVHLWNYPITDVDSEYAHEVAASDTRIEIFSPSLENLKLMGAIKKREKKGRTFWEGLKKYFRKKIAGDPYHFFAFYDHYAKNLGDEDILIKCDNDILYIKHLDRFVQFVRDTEYTTYYPNIVNNYPASEFQNEDGMLTEVALPTPLPDRARRSKMGRWGIRHYTVEPNLMRSPSLAILVHNKFLSAPDAFLKDTVHEWSDTRAVSNNLFALRGKSCRALFAEYCKKYATLIDDVYFCAVAPRKSDFSAVMYMNAVVSHFQYRLQLDENTPPAQRAELENILRRYEQLAP